VQEIGEERIAMDYTKEIEIIKLYRIRLSFDSDLTLKVYV